MNGAAIPYEGSGIDLRYCQLGIIGRGLHEAVYTTSRGQATNQLLDTYELKHKTHHSLGALLVD